jgi:hypothetical protein
LFLAGAGIGLYAGATPRIEILVVDKSPVPAAILAGAEAYAAGVMQAAGVVTRWVHCTPGAEETPPECLPPFMAHRILLQVLPPELAGSMQYGSAFGFTFPVANEAGHPYRAGVLWSKAESFAADHRCDPALLLGRIMAHEIGHLLLGSGSHAVAGLMKADWRGREMQSLAQGRLLFSRSEARRMQQEALERIRTAFAEPRFKADRAVLGLRRDTREVKQ